MQIGSLLLLLLLTIPAMEACASNHGIHNTNYLVPNQERRDRASPLISGGRPCIDVSKTIERIRNPKLNRDDPESDFDPC